MKKYTKLSISWFYELLDRGECDVMDFKEQLEDKNIFGKSIKILLQIMKKWQEMLLLLLTIKVDFCF